MLTCIQYYLCLLKVVSLKEDRNVSKVVGVSLLPDCTCDAVNGHVFYVAFWVGVVILFGGMFAASR
jgi:hypothetical protein